MRQRISYIFILFIALAVTSGCVSQTVWRYDAEPRSELPVVVDRTVAVIPFADRRANVNHDLRPMALVPGVPYSWLSLNVPEKARWYVNDSLYLLFLGTHVLEHQADMNEDTIARWDPEIDLAQITVDELKAANIFSGVYLGGDNEEAPLIFQGIINSTNYEGRVATYCLSVFGPILWCLGFPVTYVSNDIDLTLRLIDQRTNQVLWERSYYRSGVNVSTIFYIQEDFSFLELIKEIMIEAMEDMRVELMGRYIPLLDPDEGPHGSTQER